MTAKKVNVLVADDERGIRDTISLRFKKFGFNIDTAASGNEAWQMLEKNRYDIVITDIRMPNGNGLELLERIKERNIDFPKVYFISGFADLSLEDVFDLGADGLFAKPFSTNMLMNSIRKAFLSLEDRWAKIPADPKFKIMRKYNKLSTAYNNGDINIGRGGLFLKIEDRFPHGNVITAFKIEIGDNIPCAEISGIGQIQWARKGKRPGLPPGVGIEILFLEDHCRDKYINWLKEKKIRKFIPKK